jgi:RNA polymerase sigma factor (sigma-70 family)
MMRWGGQAEDMFIEFFPLAQHVAKIRARMVNLTGTDLERQDLEQVGLMAGWRALPRFDPTRAAFRTFLECVIRKGISSFVRSARLKPMMQPLSLSVCGAGAETQAFALRLDVSRILEHLDPADRNAAFALFEYSPAAASRELGIARSTLYRRMDRIRSAFEKAGFGPAPVRK